MILEEDRSPAQIAGVLRKEGTHIVKQTIYNHVHEDTTGKLASHMPHQLKYKISITLQTTISALYRKNNRSPREKLNFRNPK